MQRVTMGLSDTDIRNAKRIETLFNTRTKAAAVGTSLSISKAITDELLKGNTILVQTPNGETKQLVFTGFDRPD